VKVKLGTSLVFKFSFVRVGQMLHAVYDQYQFDAHFVPSIVFGVGEDDNQISDFFL
jgi:hypothetical protein